MSIVALAFKSASFDPSWWILLHSYNWQCWRQEGTSNCTNSLTTTTWCLRLCRDDTIPRQLSTIDTSLESSVRTGVLELMWSSISHNSAMLPVMRREECGFKPTSQELLKANHRYKSCKVLKTSRSSSLRYKEEVRWSSALMEMRSFTKAKVDRRL